MASEEQCLTDSINNEDSSKSEIQETLAREGESRKEGVNIDSSLYLKQEIANDEANSMVFNGVISSSSIFLASPSQTESSYDNDKVSESSSNYNKKSNLFLEDNVCASTILEDIDAPEDAQKSLSMESHISESVQVQFSEMLQEVDLVLSNVCLSRENVSPEISEPFEKIIKTDENVSVINDADSSDLHFTLATTNADNEEMLDLVIDIPAVKAISQIGICKPEDICTKTSDQDYSEKALEKNNESSKIEDLLVSSDKEVLAESVKNINSSIALPDEDTFECGGESFSGGDYTKDCKNDNNLKEATEQQPSCVEGLAFNSSENVIETVDCLAQDSGSESTMKTEFNSNKDISCSDTSLEVHNINTNNCESEIFLKIESDEPTPVSTTLENSSVTYLAEGVELNIAGIISNKIREELNILPQFVEGSNKVFSDLLVSEEQNDMQISTIEKPNEADMVSNDVSLLEKETNINIKSNCQNFKDILELENNTKPVLIIESQSTYTEESDLKIISEESDESHTVSLSLKDINSVAIKMGSLSVLKNNNNDVETSSNIDASQSPLVMPLPSISEKVQEDSQFEGIFNELEFNLQNSPMLRRSRQSPEEKNRRDCRFIFGEDDVGSGEGKDETLSNLKPFVTLRDSLDIAKHASIFDDSEMAKLKSLGEETNGKKLPEASACQEKKISTSQCISSQIKSSPPQYQSSRVLGRNKKTSIKSDKEKDNNRRVSFPDDDSRLITSYLEPVNPWYHMNVVSTDIISEAYKSSCARHKTRALPIILQQIAALPVDVVGGRIECLNARNHKLEAVQCESLEEIFRRVQFHTLDFENCELDDDSAIPLFDMMEFYDSAIHLNISLNNKIGIRGWHACARMLKRTPSLKILEARSTNLSEQNIPIICKALRLGTHLHTLHLENCNLTGRPLVSLAGALRLNNTIADLYLADNRLGVNDCIHLGNLVRSNKVLRLLDLRNNNIQDAGCNHICKEIADQQNSLKNPPVGEILSSPTSKIGLTTLVLWNNHITVQGVQYISLMLHSNCTLETLNLGRNNITSEGILRLKTSLMRNKTLRRIGLQATRVENEGAVALAECIADNQVLSRIDLRENNIQVAGLLALSRSLKINNSVIQLDLDSNPRAEPSSDLSDQHLALYQDIKNLCQHNHTNDHIRREKKEREEEKAESSILLSPEKRKISLTCETTTKSFNDQANETPYIATPISESKRYRSPDPSPSVSPCPSPSLSPSPSPVPSPLKNRFKVCRVKENNANTSFIAGGAVLSTSAPAFLMHNPMSGSLPSLVSTARPNRFSTGSRFTVTKVTESNFKSSLPCSRAMSSPSLIVLPEKGDSKIAAPTIVVSSPNKAVRGFSVEEEGSISRGPNRNASLDLPISTTSSSSPSSDSSSPQDDVFFEDEQRIGSSLANEGNNNNSTKNSLEDVTSLLENKEVTDNSNAMCSQTPVLIPSIQRAPLASIEGGSVDSDSEDSDLMTQSSDSTRSDEIRISAEETSPPILAWAGEKSSHQIKAAALPSIVATTIEESLLAHTHPIKEESSNSINNNIKNIEN